MSVMRRDFARYFVLNGGKPSHAAALAGFSDSDLAKAAQRCLLDPKVISEIKRLSVINVGQWIPFAFNVLIGIASDLEVSPDVRRKAAVDLLDRAGVPAQKGGVQVNVGVQVNGNEVQALIGSIWEAKSAKVPDLSGIPPAMTDTIGALDHDENGFGEPIDGGGHADERVPAPVSSIPLSTATARSFTGFSVEGVDADQEDGDGLFE